MNEILAVLQYNFPGESYDDLVALSYVAAKFASKDAGLGYNVNTTVETISPSPDETLIVLASLKAIHLLSLSILREKTNNFVEMGLASLGTRSVNPTFVSNAGTAYHDALETYRLGKQLGHYVAGLNRYGMRVTH